MTPLTQWMRLADPIHGIIQFDKSQASHRLLLDVMNTGPFQRLRRIKQMGLAEFVFPGATHTRFVHSLGATHLMMQAIAHLGQMRDGVKALDATFEGIPISQLLLLAILIHDIGHPPLSHTLEDILDLKAHGLYHDDYWNERILLEDADMQRVWERHNPALPSAVLKFMGGNGSPETKHFLATLVSSQLDMDRLDYLQRDSHFLGVQYGRIEADRIIANFEIGALPNGHTVLAIREEALPAVEHYLFGRHQAYKMALHALDKASEALLKKLLERFKWVMIHHGSTGGRAADELYRLMVDGKSLSIQSYLRLDDCYLWEVIHSWANHATDPLLKTLAQRMLHHDLFKFVDLAKYGFTGAFCELTPVYDALKTYYDQRGLSFEFGFEETRVSPKALYQPPGAREPIWIRTAWDIRDLREVSSLPLTVKTDKGHKHLLFVWDKEARQFLSDTLRQVFNTPEMTWTEF
jgi:HD superfamily phosphohydrolase